MVEYKQEDGAKWPSFHGLSVELFSYERFNETVLKPISPFLDLFAVYFETAPHDEEEKSAADEAINHYLWFHKVPWEVVDWSSDEDANPLMIMTNRLPPDPLDRD